MKTYLYILTAIFLLLFTVSGSTAKQSTPVDSEQESSAKTDSKRFVTIDFDNVDISIFIKYISELTGKNFIIDKTVKGAVTVLSPTKISEEEAYRVFESVLEVNGFTTVKAGPVIKIVPAVRARTQNVKILRHGLVSHPEDKIVTQLIPLKNTTPDEMKKVLAPLVSKTSVVIAHTPSGMLIITDTLSNIQKLLAIIKVLDVTYTGDEIVVIPLEHAAASTVAKTLSTIFQKASGAKKKGGKSAIQIVPYDRINSLVVLASAADVLRVKRIIGLLDTEMEKGDGNIHVVYLQNATAVELAKVLTALPAKQSSAKNTKGKAPALSNEVNIMAEEDTNSLIITATKGEYKLLLDVISKLDIPRRMVYLEALIMEVNTDKTFDVGVRWIGGGTFSDGTGAVVSGWGGSDGFKTSGFTDIDADSGLPTVGTGFSLGILKQGIEIGGITFPNISAILKAYRKDSSINIIATPQILTTDNKEARISVGENRPYQTKGAEATEGTSNTYSSYEYKDVGTTLTITPQINQHNTLRLDIKTEVSKFNEAATGSDKDRPVTYKRETETTVLVNDNETIVIGGIIGHDATESEWKVPLLGDIPLLGWLFKTNTTTHTKTNMFIFITPHIIKNPADIARVTKDKEDRLQDVMPQVEEELHREESKENSMQLSDLGYEKLQQKDFSQAREYFIHALDIDPHNPFALINMGVVYEHEGLTEMAMGMYRQVIIDGSKLKAGKASSAGKSGAGMVEIAKDNLSRLQGLQ